MIKDFTKITIAMLVTTIIAGVVTIKLMEVFNV